MSYRYSNAFVDPGLNTLVAPTPIYQLGLQSWGRNNYGQLGLSNTTSYSSPKQVGSLTDWKQISAFAANIAAVKTNNTLWTWGLGNRGGLGLNNTTSYSSPTQVGALTNWLQVSTGYSCVIAVKTDGTLWSWGNNSNGQLGLGNITYYSSPVQVGSLTNWSLASANTRGFCFAIKTDGTLWAWGSNGQGQLGIGNTTSYSSPVQVGSLTNWLQISCGYYVSALALKTDGTLWSWGRNNYGQLGLGNTISYSSPKQVGALKNWKAIYSGVSSVLALKTDGTLWAWGRNNFGQLGLGNRTYYSSPKQVGSLTNWSKICVNTAAAAIKTDGTLWSWSQNNFGQLGLGNITSYSSPKQVGSLTNWISLAASYQAFYSLAY
jgi:alpha-tubulin suppressor-like RCC1 family protein